MKMAFVFSIREAIDMVLMSLIVGFIFMDFLKRYRQASLEEYYLKKNFISRYFNFNDFKFAVLATAPAILLHELGHKFTAMAFGFTAVFNAAYVWLGLGVIMKFVGFVFFVPAYVSISAPAGATIAPSVYSLIAFAGPAVNLALWLLAIIALKKNWFGEKYRGLLVLTKWINLFLFVFNMLPLPGFDGLKVYTGIFQAIV